MKNLRRNSWPWVLSAYFAEGLPYQMITTVSIFMLSERMVRGSHVVVAASLLSLPWSLKALWSPAVDLYRTKRWWMLAAGTGVALCMGIAAGVLTWENWLPWTLMALALGAFCSATYDVACDGFYMQALDSEQQSFFVGFRSTAYRLSTLFCSGVVLSFEGALVRRGSPAPTLLDDVTFAWCVVFGGIAVLMLLFQALHGWLLPHPYNDSIKRTAPNDVSGAAAAQNNDKVPGFWSVLRSFLMRKDLGFTLIFLLAYRLGEAMLSKVAVLFLVSSRETGGLALDNLQCGVVYGTVGVAALLTGGILGGMYIAKIGLRRALLPMALLLNLPDLLYVWMSATQPEHLWTIGIAVAVEQFGYGFGLTAYMVYMLQAVKGAFATSHYAFLTCVMALGLMLPSAVSGYIQESLGYTAFFVVACVCTLPCFAVCWWLKRKME